MTSVTFDNSVGPSDTRRARRLGLLLSVFGLVLWSALQVSTQVFAKDFRYHASLGRHLEGVYAPWSILQWAERWYGTYPQAVMRAAHFGLAVLAAGVVALAVLKAALARPHHYLHGSARWANAKDLKRAGLLPRARGVRARRAEAAVPAVYVGAWKDRKGKTHYLKHSGPEHVLGMAPTRSGKGVGLVVPTLLSWTESAFVTDLKGELFSLTAGWRHACAGNTVLRFEPASSTNTVCWNPLDELRIGTDHEVGDAQNLALLLVDPNGKGVEGDHWRSTAMGLLVGVILHVIGCSKAEGSVAALASIDVFLSDPGREADQLWYEMVQSPHPVVATEGRKMLNRPQEEAGSVLSTAQRCLALYHDPVVAKNTSRSDFGLRDLMHSAAPVTLYLVTQPSDKDRLRPLVRIFVSMAIHLLADRLDFEGGTPKAHYKHKLLMMMDEFVALRRLQVLQEALAYIAAYGIKFYLICQDRQQLTSRDYGYGPDETITGNAHVQVMMRPDKVETAEYVSKKVGQTTVAHEQVTRNGSGPFAKTSRTGQFVQRPLLTADECMRLPGPKTEGDRVVEGGEMLVFAAGMPAARGPQPLYFKDPIFAARAAVPPPTLPYARAGQPR